MIQHSSAAGVDAFITYETRIDISHELETIDVIEQAWSCSITRLPKFSAIDWLCSRDGRVVAVAEYKHRRGSWPSIWIAKAKYDALIHESRWQVRVPPLFVVRTDEGLFWINVGKQNPEWVTRGRTTRGVTELVWECPMDLFRRVI